MVLLRHIFFIFLFLTSHIFCSTNLISDEDKIKERREKSDIAEMLSYLNFNLENLNRDIVTITAINRNSLDAKRKGANSDETFVFDRGNISLTLDYASGNIRMKNIVIEM